jgi:translation initiation factor IF-3
LDLVEVAPNSKPPVAKIMDYGKFKYEEAQKAKEARRNQANTILKEVRFRLKIDVHDYETKRKRAEGFLAAGDKVKAMILFRGREQSRPDQGVRLLQRFAEDVSEFGSVESNPTIDGRNMVMVIGPHKTKATAKAEAHAKQPSRQRGEAPSREAAGAAPAEKPVVETAPVVEKTPVAEKTPVVAAPVTAAPVAEKPVAQRPVAQKPVAAKPAAEKPVAESPAAEKPTVKAAPAPSPAARKAVPGPATPKATPAAPRAATPKPAPAPKPGK